MRSENGYPSYRSYPVEFKIKPLMAFGYYGGKARLSSDIGALLDYNASVYVEPFGGSAAVLLNKPPHTREVYAEKELSLCCFWRCLSDRETAIELVGKLGGLVYSRESFDKHQEIISKAHVVETLSDDEVIEVAVACFVMHTMSRDNAGIRFGGGRFPSNASYLKTIERIPEVADRFRGTEVLCDDALDLLGGTRFDSPDVMLYLDPVYLPEAGRKRSFNHTLYRHPFGYDEHVRLLERVRGMRSKILISGYDDNTRLYDRYLIEGEGLPQGFRPWHKYEILSVSTVARGDKKRSEVLWANYG
ncbi:DNA methyltransferase [Clostridia bacterium]|nr:DNA methyltransferase [Clostridia bacterium]